MSEEDNAIKLSWEGKIPVCFSMDASDCSKFLVPDPFFAMIPRRLYFPMVMDKALNHFESDAATFDPARIWLEWNGVPLKWNYPVGLLYDVCQSLTPNGGSTVFSITIRFHKNFPEDEVLFWPKVEDVEIFFMSTIKEADAIKHRSSVMSSLHKRDYQQLWSSLLTPGISLSLYIGC